MKGKNVIWIIVVLAIAVVGYYIWSEYNRENADVSDSKADVTTSAASLIKEFADDSLTASKKYIDKTVLVSGEVKSVDTSGVISLGVAGDMSSVQCTMDKRHTLDYSTVKEGTTVSIKGKCSGYETQELLGTDVKMNFCVLQKQNKNL